MAVETYLQGAEVSAAQFFEIWHHYDSDGDSFSFFFPVPAWKPSGGGGDFEGRARFGEAEKALSPASSLLQAGNFARRPAPARSFFLPVFGNDGNVGTVGSWKGLSAWTILSSGGCFGSHLLCEGAPSYPEF